MYASIVNEQISLKLLPFLKLPKSLKRPKNHYFILLCESFLCPKVNFMKTKLFYIHPENLPVSCQLCQRNFTQCSSISNKKILRIPQEQPHPCLLTSSQANLLQPFLSGVWGAYHFQLISLTWERTAKLRLFEG